MFGKLEVTLGHDIVAGGLRVAAKLHVFFGNCLRRAAHFNVWPVALKNPVCGIPAASVVAAASATPARPAVITATAAFVVLALTCAVSIIEVQIITAAKIAVPCC
jgi:hypothetical protein